MVYDKDLVKYLKTTTAIREQCYKILSLAEADSLPVFKYDPGKLSTVSEFVLKIINDSYKNFDVPYHSRWRHFSEDRMSKLNNDTVTLMPLERAKSKIELAIVSVLLDAGAGMTWRYKDKKGIVTKMSEGLAAASFDMFMEGAFSSNKANKLQVDSKGLYDLNSEDLKSYLQVSDENPLNGFDGRLLLLKKLGEAISSNKTVFGGKDQRLGNILDYLLANKTKENKVSATDILDAVIYGLGSIWPGRIVLNNENMGDVWEHESLNSQGLNLIPFHKLSQWLTYSLLEPLEEVGIKITNMDKMTGLAEYRNGGLFVDFGVIVPRDNSVFDQAHLPSSKVIVEWRALTLCLLDKVAEDIRKKSGLKEDQLPLAKVLQGGTWVAGRKIAAEKRSDGGPPIKILSDGTVF